jgi:LL-diaminopimelate aminotransferase
MSNADMMCQSLRKFGYQVYGGQHAPYIWLQTPKGIDSWSFFDMLLNRANVVCTPGAGFGAAGEGFVRLSAFNHPDRIKEAMERIGKL